MNIYVMYTFFGKTLKFHEDNSLKNFDSEK